MKPRLFYIFSALSLTLCVAAGCARDNMVVHAHFQRDFVVVEGKQSPEEMAETLGSGFVVTSIAPDGTTTIRDTDSGVELFAQPGGYFIDDDCSGPWGTQGLMLLSSSEVTRTASFRRFWGRMFTTFRDPEWEN